MTQALHKHWNSYYDQGRDFRFVTSATMNKLLSYYNNNAPKTVLDIGCGTGQLTRELWHRGYKVVGIDVSKSALTIAKALTIVPDTELYYTQIDIEQDSVANLPFQPYGLITCKLVYAFMRDKPALLKTVTQLLDSSGIFVVMTPLVETTPPEKKGIAVSQEEVAVLREQFEQLAWYEEHDLGFFVGTRKLTVR